MEQALMVFEFQDQGVRAIEDEEGIVWFVVKDVCQVLGIRNHRDAVAGLDDDEKDGVAITDAIGRQQETLVVDESGLYALIFQSRKPEARAFRKWVTSEVLPTLRKTGKVELTSELQGKLERWTGYGEQALTAYQKLAERLEQENGDLLRRLTASENALAELRGDFEGEVEEVRLRSMKRWKQQRGGARRRKKRA